MKKSTKTNMKRQKASKRMTISFKWELYKKVVHLQKETHVKSYSRAVNILLNDEVSNRPRYDPQIQRLLIQIISHLAQQFSKLNQNLSGACNNLNQIAYVLNIKKYKHKKINPADFNMQNGLKIMHDIQIIQKYKNSIQENRKEVDKLWRLLM